MPVVEVPENAEDEVPPSVTNLHASHYDPQDEEKQLSKWWIGRQIQQTPYLRDSIITGIWTGIGVGFFSFPLTKNVMRSIDIAWLTWGVTMTSTWCYSAYHHNKLYRQINTPLPRDSAVNPVAQEKAVSQLVGLLKQDDEKPTDAVET